MIKCNLLKERISLFIKISLKFDPLGQIGRKLGNGPGLQNFHFLNGWKSSLLTLLCLSRVHWLSIWREGYSSIAFVFYWLSMWTNCCLFIEFVWRIGAVFTFYDWFTELNINIYENSDKKTEICQIQTNWNQFSSGCNNESRWCYTHRHCKEWDSYPGQPNR